MFGFNAEDAEDAEMRGDAPGHRQSGEEVAGQPPLRDSASSASLR